MFLISLTAIFSFQSIAAGYAAKNFSLDFEILTRDIKVEVDNIGSLKSGSFRRELYRRMKNSGACRVYFIDDRKRCFDFGSCGEEAEIIPGIAESVLKNKKSLTKFIVEGLYLPFIADTRRIFIMAAPMRVNNNSIVGSIVASWDFDVYFSGFKKLEQTLFVYVLINTFALAAVGVYQIGNITAKPLSIILKKTESVSPYSLTMSRRPGSGFDHLSSAIGALIDDLSTNKKNLQATIAQLESVNQNMRNMQREIIKAEKMASIGRLSAGLAHEIGNPLGIISGYIEMLRHDEIGDLDRIEFASRADAELKRIDSIIRELLDYARPSDHVRKTLSVHQIIRELVSAYSGSKVIGSIELKTQLDAGSDVVMANPDQLRQVFMNLIINALDAISVSENRYNGILLISTTNISKNEEPYSELMVSFIDNGCGLEDANAEDVFEPFFTTKPPGQGTGLGLSVSQMIVQDMGGSITALNSENGGTEVRICLPVLHDIPKEII